MTLDQLRSDATPGRGGFMVFPEPYRQMSVTLEDAEFLYALVRLTKPERVLEIGSGYGVSGLFIGQALADNGSLGGRLETVEPDEELRDHASHVLAFVPAFVGGFADENDLDWDLVFIDSDYTRRQDDITAWLTNGYRGLVCVHDAHRSYDLADGVGVMLPCTDGLWLGRAA